MTSQHAILPRSQPFWGQVQIWTATTASYRAGSVDSEGGANDGTVLFCNMLAI